MAAPSTLPDEDRVVEWERAPSVAFPLLPGEIEREALHGVAYATGAIADPAATSSPPSSPTRSSRPRKRSQDLETDHEHSTTHRATINAVLGVLRLTNFRLTFSPYAAAQLPNPNARLAASFQLPLAAIDNVQCGACGMLEIATKDLRVLRLNLDHAQISATATSCATSRESVVLSWLDSLTQPETPAASLDTMFAFEYVAAKERLGMDAPLPSQDGWQLYSPPHEFRRLGFFPSIAEAASARSSTQSTAVTTWQMIRSPDFRFSPTYPLLMVAPTGLTANDLKRSACMHAHARLPVAVWRHPTHQCVLARAATPSKAWKDSALSVILHEAFRRAAPSIVGRHQVGLSKPLFILDARKATERTRRRSMSMGSEAQTRMEFLGIPNVHKMRDALQAVKAIVTAGDLDDNDDTYFSRLGKTGWLQYVAKTLAGARRIAEVLHESGASVIVRSKGGWDRAPLLTSLAQLMLDPYYRTIRGFAVLVEKEWCSFGHKFADRIGVGKSAQQDADERSPVMLLFLDCVWQMMRQFPSAFEFTDKLLLHMWDALISGLYGTFLHNTERERDAANVRERTESVWSPVLENPEAFENRAYQAAHGVLYPRKGVRHVASWDALFLRWDAENQENEGNARVEPTGCCRHYARERSTSANSFLSNSFLSSADSGFDWIQGDLTVL